MKGESQPMLDHLNKHHSSRYHTPANQPTRYKDDANFAIIFRIIGNENPPRDTIGKRLSVLEYILKNEPKFENVQKWYLLNRLHNIQYRRSVCELLDRYNAKYITIPLNRESVITADSKEEQIIKAIDINNARNYAIEFGILLAKYVIILDGDCLFYAEGWKPVAD